MLNIRKSENRGRGKIDWLDSYHSFSFGDYFDRGNMNYRALRVINEDVIAPAMGFGKHPHKNMEIITLVLSGSLKHEDSLGSSAVIDNTVIQKMSAGSGILHSEVNNSNTEAVHLYQIWLMPNEMDIEPSYEEAVIDPISKELYLAGEKSDGALVSLRQDAKLNLYKLDSGERRKYSHQADRHYWYQVVSGEVIVNDQEVKAGDAFTIEEGTEVSLNAKSALHVLRFDLA